MKANGVRLLGSPPVWRRGDESLRSSTLVPLAPSGLCVPTSPTSAPTPVSRLLVLLLLSSLLSGAIPAQELLRPFSAPVVSIADGDTLTVLHGRQQIRIRLEGIDAPERGDPFSQAARDRLAALVFRRHVAVIPDSEDRYGRLVARVFLRHREDELLDISQILVREGLAWHYVRYSDDPSLAAAQRLARNEGRGVWSRPHLIPPWERRRAPRP